MRNYTHRKCKMNKSLRRDRQESKNTFEIKAWAPKKGYFSILSKNVPIQGVVKSLYAHGVSVLKWYKVNAANISKYDFISNRRKTMNEFLTMADVEYVRENWASQDAKIVADETTELKEEYLEAAKTIYNTLNIIEEVHYDYRDGTSRTFYLKLPDSFCYWSKAEIKLELYGYVKELNEAV